MGINVLSNTSSQEVRLSTSPTNTIASGDVVVNAQSGYAQTASTALTVAQNNNSTAGPSAIFPLASYASNSGGSTNNSYTSITQMSNGVFATAYTGDQTSNATISVKVSFRTLTGATPYVTVAAQTTSFTCYQPKIRSIPNAGCVVAWGNQTSSLLQFAIYSNTGAVVKAATNVSASSFTDSTSIGYWNLNVLTNGNIVFCYRIVNSMYYAVFDSSGNVVLAETLIEASSSPIGMCVTPQTNGNFVVAYNNTSVGSKFARYSPSGVLQGALTTTASPSTSYINHGNNDYFCVELSNGNLVFQYGGTSSFPRYAVYTSAGVLITSNANFYNSSSLQSSSYLVNSAFAAITATSSGFIALGRGSSNFYFTLYDFNGVALTAPKVTAFTPSGLANSTANYALYVLNLGNAGFVIYSGQIDSCLVTNSLNLWCINDLGATQGSTVAISSGGSQSYGQYALLTQDGSLAMGFAQSNSVYFSTYAVQKKSIIGVAQEAITINSTGRIATLGTYTTNQNFASGGNFDQRTATPVGSKGTVVGTAAVLFGLT